MAKKQELVVGVTGSIAVYRACEIVSRLKQLGYGISVIMTEEATKFVTPLSFQSLSQSKVYLDMFKAADDWKPLHTSLAERAELILVAPATANFIGKIANGIADELLTCTILATQAKVLIAPAMNVHMYKKEVVQENITRLKRRGYKFIGPIPGQLACGYKGLGHLAKVENIVKEVKKILR